MVKNCPPYRQNLCSPYIKLNIIKHQFEFHEAILINFLNNVCMFYAEPTIYTVLSHVLPLILVCPIISPFFTHFVYPVHGQ